MVLPFERSLTMVKNLLDRVQVFFATQVFIALMKGALKTVTNLVPDIPVIWLFRRNDQALSPHDALLPKGTGFKCHVEATIAASVTFRLTFFLDVGDRSPFDID
jgi:hypothetical protein